MNDKFLSRKDLKRSLLEDNVDIYFHVDEISNDEEYPFIECSLVTIEMIKYDRFIFSNLEEKNANNDFNEKVDRPYFVSFTITDKNTIKCFRERVENNTGDHNDDIWYKTKLIIPSRNTDADNKIVNLVVATSPIIIKKRLININDIDEDPKIAKEINKLYKKNFSADSIKSNIKLLDNIHKNCGKVDFIKVYKVGDGNCNYIHFRSKYEALYDIGYNVKSIPAEDISNYKYKGSTSAIRILKPKFVVLSHWDMDHYIGCAYGNNTIFNVPWIVPKYGIENSTNSLRLAKYLSIKHKLLVIDKETEIPISNEITIYKGDKKDKFVSKKNCMGIYLSIDKKVLLLGDVPYLCLSNKIVDYDFIVAPHHGGKMEYPKKESRKDSNKIAIFSTSKKNKNRPDKEHEEYLEKLGFTTKCTEDVTYNYFKYKLKDK